MRSVFLCVRLTAVLLLVVFTFGGSSGRAAPCGTNERSHRLCVAERDGNGETTGNSICESLTGEWPDCGPIPSCIDHGQVGDAFLCSGSTCNACEDGDQIVIEY